MNELEAKEILRGMTFEECMEMWNEGAADHYMRAYEIHEIDDSEWWEWLMKEAGGWDFVHDLLSSGESFNLTDRFFFHDTEGGMFISFSTKQEFIEAVEEDFFVNEIINRPKED